MAEKAIALTEQNFNSTIANGLVLVDFWAPWCGPCRMIAPVVEELAGEYEGKMVVGKVNVDENRQLAINYGVMSIPTLIFFKNGQPVERVVGYKGKKDLQAIIDKLLA